MDLPSIAATISWYSRLALHTAIADPPCCGCMPDGHHTNPGDSSILEEVAGQPHCPHAVADEPHSATLPQFTWGCCNRRPRKARRPAARVKVRTASLRYPHITIFVGSDTRMLQCCSLPVSAMQESKAMAAESSWAALQSARPEYILRGILVTSCWLCRQHLLLLPQL